MAAAVLLVSCIATSLPAQQPSGAGDDIDALRRQASQLSRTGKFAEAFKRRGGWANELEKVATAAKAAVTPGTTS